VSRVGNAVAFDIRVLFMPDRLTLTNQRIQGDFPDRLLGVHTIGSYEYTVPTPREERFIRIVAKGKEREVELKEVPAETVKRLPVGAGLGLLAGWAAGALAYALAFRPKNDEYSENSVDSDVDRDSSGLSRE
jgi:hypothetical protein